MRSIGLNEKGELITFVLNRGLEYGVLSVDALVLNIYIEVSHLRSIIRYCLQVSSLRSLRLVLGVDVQVRLGF